MTQLSVDTVLTYAQIGRREDLSDVIDDVSPTERPFTSSIKRGVATGGALGKHEFMMSKLRAAAANRRISGDQATIRPVLQPQRLYTYLQISDEVASISGTAGAVDLAGRTSEMARAKARKLVEIMLDIEFMFTAHSGGSSLPPANIVGDSSTARSSAGYQTWMGPNTSNRSGTATTGLSTTVAQPTDAAQLTNGTQRDLTEDLLKNGLQLVWTQGGKVRDIICGPVNRAKISGFTGNATRTVTADSQKLIATIGVYASDWGEHRVVPSHFSQERDVLLVDNEHWSLDFLRPMQSWPLGKRGDSDEWQILCEYGLAALNPWASGIIADLTTT